MTGGQTRFNGLSVSSAIVLDAKVQGNRVHTEIKANAPLIEIATNRKQHC